MKKKIKNKERTTESQLSKTTFNFIKQQNLHNKAYCTSFIEHVAQLKSSSSKPIAT